MAVDMAVRVGALQPGIPHALFGIAIGQSGLGQPDHRWVVSAPTNRRVMGPGHLRLQWERTGAVRDIEVTRAGRAQIHACFYPR